MLNRFVALAVRLLPDLYFCASVATLLVLVLEIIRGITS